MNITEIITHSDFCNLNQADIDSIKKELDITIPKDIDCISYLYEIRSTIYKNNTCKDIVLNKCLAGITTVKWYGFNIQDKDEENAILEAIEDMDSFNSVRTIDINKLTGPSECTCIKKDEGVYLTRTLIPLSSKRVSNGNTYTKVPNIRNVVSIVDINNKYIEVRASSKDADKVVRHLASRLKLKNIYGIRVLGRYSNQIEQFKNSLLNAKFIDTTSVPDAEITLTKEESSLLASVLIALDEYFINKDIDKFNTQLKEIEIDTEGIPFTQLFLAGMSKIGMSIRPDIEEDLCCQSLYTILKKYLTNHTGYITFSNIEKGSNITIQVGIKTNSITFRSSSTEGTIEYIRSKIL